MSGMGGEEVGFEGREPARPLSPWTAEPLVLALAAVAAAFFAQGFLRLRRRGRADHAPWTRAALFAAGLALLVLPLVSPLDALGDRYLLSAHMLQHVLIADVGARAVLVALRGPLLFFAVPDRAPPRVPATRASLRRFAAWLLRPGVGTRRLGARLRPLAHPRRLRRRRRAPARPPTSSTRASSSPGSSSGRSSSTLPARGRLCRGRRLAMVGAALRHGNGDRRRADLQPPPALPGLRRAGPPRVRPLAAPRPAARRARDDPRPDAHPRHLRRAPAPAGAAPPPRTQRLVGAGQPA